MNERFIYQLIGVTIFGGLMESLCRLAPKVVVFISMAMLAQIYIHSFPQTIKLVKRESKFAKEMQMFKR